VTFSRVQAKRKLRASSPEGGTPQPVSPLHVGPQGVLTPFLRCGHCGGRVIVVASSRKDTRTWLYFCGTRRDNKAACPGVSVRVDTLDPRVLDAIEQQVLEPRTSRSSSATPWRRSTPPTAITPLRS